MTTAANHISVTKGDLFESDAQCLVNTVNTVGVMGKGIALGFKKKFPDMYRDYVERCERGEVKLGEPYLFRRLMPPWIINFPTKGHWRAQSKLSDIDVGLAYLEDRVDEWGVESLAVPPLGCGEGGLEWRIVGPRLYEHLSKLGIRVVLYAPFNTPHEELQIEYLGERHDDVTARGSAPESRIPPAAVALVEVLARLKQNPYQPPIGRIFFQKLAYFATEKGLPTGLQFQRSSFGPYAPELKRLNNRLINNGLVEEQKIGQRFDVRVGSTFERARGAYEADLTKWEKTIGDLVDLFSRMSTRQAEVAATVHFAAKELWAKTGGAPVPEIDVFREVQHWKAGRTPALEDDEMATAIRNLGMMGWMKVEASPDLPVREELVA